MSNKITNREKLIYKITKYNPHEIYFKDVFMYLLEEIDDLRLDIKMLKEKLDERVRK